MKTTFCPISTFALTLISTTNAGSKCVRTPPRDPFVNGRQAVQSGRIAEGVKSGELTRPEAARLHHQQQVIRGEERAYKADGKLSSAERKALHQDLNKTTSDIYKQKHDAQSR